MNKIHTDLQDTISQLKSLQDVLQNSQKEAEEKGKKVEELDKMLNESMEELQQKDKNLKEKENKVVELDKALKERQWELKQKAAQVRQNLGFVLIKLFTFECRKVKNNVITLANHNTHKQSNEPLRTRSKYMQPVPSAGKLVQTSHS